ncbi:MAG: hypothetical protein LBI59_01710 [Candidatus Accumulibacter sp.]|jgi:hypothetical protein|nr:hypothetical protein [Accumulibacter sp.]
MGRQVIPDSLETQDTFGLLIVVDAANRGLKVVLVEIFGKRPGHDHPKEAWNKKT